MGASEPHPPALTRRAGFPTLSPRMMRPGTSILAAAVLLGGFSAVMLAQDPWALSPRPGVLLLRNGQALSGAITPSGDHYLVGVPGGELRIRSSEVEMLCRDLDEGYQRKRAALAPDRIDDHLTLAQWCLRHELIGYAAREIRTARSIAPTHPGVRLVERQLAALQEEPAPVAATTTADESRVTREELDSMTRVLPNLALETFTTTVQPLLLNRCSTGGCHTQRSEGKLQLARVSGSAAFSRRLTQRNLYAVLQLVDRDHPAASPLLSEAVRAHGMLETAPLTRYDAQQFQQLAGWVQLVAMAGAGSTRSTATPFGESSEYLPDPIDAIEPSPPVDSLVPPTIPRLASASGSPEAAVPSELPSEPSEPVREAPPSDDAVQPRLKTTPPPWRPVDAFDPEIFNRRYFPPADGSP